MVLTEQQQTDIYPAASLETSNVALEQNYYNITSGQIVDKMVVTGLPVYVNHNIIPNNPVNPAFDNANSAKLYKLNKNTQNIGLGITLKIMAGDKLDIYGKSYYFQNNTGGTAANTAVTTLQILAGLLGGPTGSATNVHGAVTSTQLNGIPATTGLINTLLGNQTTTNNATPQVPKAFINYILFDEQFKCVTSGFAPLGANSVLTDYGTNPALHNIPVTKNGFVYIYCSNESPVDVFFDNLQVMHTRGAILEETSFYPFGLIMAGISSKSAGGLENNYKFNYGTELSTNEFSDGSGLEWYETLSRGYDPQIGRFHQIDPLSEMSHEWSPYTFANDNPILFNDPLGLTADSTVKPTPPQPTPTPGFDPANPIVLETVVVTAPPKKSSGAFWSGVLDVVQTGIDIVGLIPVVGEIADGANALIYLARGDKTNALLSAAAMLPVVGTAATVGKHVRKALKYTKDQQALIDMAKRVKKLGGVTEDEAKI